MTGLVEHLGKWSFLRPRLDDDFYDRLSHRYTTALLIGASILAGGRHLISERIRCWCPTEFSLPQCLYMNDFCYVNDKYHVPYEEHLLRSSSENAQQINYYQWVTLFILMQAVFFITPTLIWRFFCDQTGFHIDLIVSQLSNIGLKADKSDRKEILNSLISATDRYIRSHTAQVKAACCRSALCRPICGVSVCLVYLTTKVFFLVNCLGQLFLINRFLGESGYTVWGWQVLREFLKSGVFPMSEIFPTVTMCDADIRKMGQNIHRYTVQCVLPVNIFHDRIYLVIWFWLLFVTIMTVVGLLSWIRMYVCHRRGFILDHLMHTDRCITEKEAPLLNDFTERYLSTDGVFLLKMVSRNVSSIELDEFLAALWDCFLEEQTSDQAHSVYGSMKNYDLDSVTLTMLNNLDRKPLHSRTSVRKPANSVAGDHIVV